ncbi:hypothetical protein [Halobacterium yunchengense]|uniref:hypothetical protein n=1 Tax=Halobacterium yunchengense TaxID=3108497 RepID=UPI0030093276
MSGDSRSAVAEPASDRERTTPTLSRAGRLLDRRGVVLAAGSVALLAVAVRATVRVLANLPFEPVAVPAAVRATTAGVAPALLAVALVAVAVASPRPTTRTGLLFAGVFALLAAVDAAVALPASVAVVAGGGLAVFGALGRPATPTAARWHLAAGAFLLGIAGSLAGGVGVLDGGRSLGAVLVLAALAALGLRASGDRLALVAGALAFVGVAAASTANPYVAGTALLVGFAVVGAPGLLVGLAVAGGTAAVVTGLRRRDYGLAVGAGLLVLAGMPATLPRAAAVLLGVALAVVGVDRLTASRDGGEVAA